MHQLVEMLNDPDPVRYGEVFESYRKGFAEGSKR
jgi:hypothetical protein